MTQNDAKLALLIDGDNIAAKYMLRIWSEARKLGGIYVRRLYCTDHHRTDWHEMMTQYALQFRQPHAGLSGKNATDIAMVIDALDFAQTGLIDGICLVSCDSDFTPLAFRLRQGGLKVYLLGKEQTPQSLRDACDDFIRVDSKAA